MNIQNILTSNYDRRRPRYAGEGADLYHVEVVAGVVVVGHVEVVDIVVVVIVVVVIVVVVFVVMRKVPDVKKEKVQIIFRVEMIKGERRRRDEVCSNQKI